MEQIFQSVTAGRSIRKASLSSLYILLIKCPFFFFSIFIIHLHILLIHLQKVFPEAAAAAREGKNQDHNPEFPSDDSDDDDDYDPDGPGINEKIEGDESSSDESEYASACDEPQAQPNDERSLGLSSDDSEDNDYNPDALDIDENVKEESSSSDFTSDSEDLAATLDDNKFSEKDEVNMSSSWDAKSHLGNSDEQSFRRGGNKSSLKGELLDILSSVPGQDGSPPISGKRHVERLDYKRLHDVSIISLCILCLQFSLGLL